jgi:hypothetical protein
MNDKARPFMERALVTYRIPIADINVTLKQIRAQTPNTQS